MKEKKQNTTEKEKEVNYFSLRSKNLDLPNEPYNYFHTLFTTKELAVADAIRWATEKESESIEFEDVNRDEYIYKPRVKYVSYFGSFNCVIEIVEMTVKG